MKKLTFALLSLTLICSTLSTFAQSDADMKAMMAYAAPGDIHQLLSKSAGAWKADISMWMQPGAQPVNSTAEATYEMILGGRYLQSKKTGNFFGMPFEGIGTIGYDNTKKVFVTTWLDNMGTGIMYLTGPWDSATKSINFTGMMVDPTAGKEVPVRQVIKFVDDNTQTMEMYSVVQGKEFKNMEMKLTRK